MHQIEADKSREGKRHLGKSREENREHNKVKQSRKNGTKRTKIMLIRLCHTGLAGDEKQMENEGRGEAIKHRRR